jgi:5-methylcytosine-specific restriction endonuclease McrA
VNLTHLSAEDVTLALNQGWQCPVCGMDLINGEQLHRHHRIPRSEGGSDGSSNRELVHLFCHQQITDRWQQQRRNADESK